MFESNREAITTQLTLMLGVRWLHEQGLYDKWCDDNPRIKTHHVSVKRLLQMGSNYRNLPAIQKEMIDVGKQQLHGFGSRLRIYDKTRKGGALVSAHDYHRVLLYDMNRYGTQFVGIDHLQRMGEGTDYEIMNVNVPRIENVCRTEKIATCLLSQVKTGDSDSSDSKRHDSGATGGNKLDSAVDTMLYVRYKQKKQADSNERYPDYMMTVGVQHNRYGASNRGAQVKIDPWSGVMLNGGKAIEWGDLNDDVEDMPQGEINMDLL
jgi:hypothetical protein